jgi:hypothetical protein
LLGEAQETATAAEPLADMEVNGVSHGSAPLFTAVSPMGPPYGAIGEHVLCHATAARIVSSLAFVDAVRRLMRE